MARLKRSSAVLETARKRLAGLKSITPPLNFTGDLNLDNYEQDILNFNTKLEEYNTMLAALDQFHNDLNGDEKNLNTKSKRMLAAVGAMFGTNSNQYEAAGGTRDDERKTPTKKDSDDS